MTDEEEVLLPSRLDLSPPTIAIAPDPAAFPALSLIVAANRAARRFSSSSAVGVAPDVLGAAVSIVANAGALVANELGAISTGSCG